MDIKIEKTREASGRLQSNNTTPYSITVGNTNSQEQVWISDDVSGVFIDLYMWEEIVAAVEACKQKYLEGEP